MSIQVSKKMKEMIEKDYILSKNIIKIEEELKNQTDYSGSEIKIDKLLSEKRCATTA